MSRFKAELRAERVVDTNTSTIEAIASICLLQQSVLSSFRCLNQQYGLCSVESVIQSQKIQSQSLATELQIGVHKVAQNYASHTNIVSIA